MSRLSPWLACTLLALWSTAHAQATPQAWDALATHPVWLELLHYEAPLIGRARSAIHSEDFFLAATGRSNPLAELHATLRALREPGNSAKNQHAACRFPARALWLRRQLGAELVVAQADCPELDEWTRRDSLESVSVVFATGFLGNPASYYGHTLLKLNSPGDTGDTGDGQLLDSTVNYGAILEGRVDPLSYIVKGILGGYDGGFSQIEYYFHQHNYGETELRDLWEYQLDLPPEDVQLIALHAWEVLGKRYTYYFFRRNCAFRMAELLQLSDGVEVIPPNRGWTIPQSLIQRFDTQGLHGARIAATRYYPSRQSRLYQRFEQLSNEDQAMLGAVIEAPATYDSVTFAERPIASQQAIVDTALDYYQFALRAEIDEPAVLNERYRIALARRYQLPPGSDSPATRMPSSPHGGRRPGWLQVSAIHNSELGVGGQIRARAAYYDALDAESGHVRNSALTMGDMTLRIDGSRLSLRQLRLIGIDNLNPGRTGLPGDRGRQWKLAVGAESLRLDCRECLVARGEADIGLATTFSNELALAGFVGGAVQNDRLDYGYGFGRIGARSVLHHGLWSAASSYEWRVPVGGRRSPYSAVDIEVRRKLGANRDWRLRLEQNGGRQLGVGLGWYW